MSGYPAGRQAPAAISSAKSRLPRCRVAPRSMRSPSRSRLSAG